ncbi:hypothetical protein [Nocardia asiatica]
MTTFRDVPAHVKPYQVPPKPIFRDTPGRWGRDILNWGGEPELRPVTTVATALATTTFYTAGHWSETFQAPTEFLINSWAHLFEFAGADQWMTLDLVERAVNAHFRQSITGRMLPADVIHGAAILKLEGGPA